jgi:integrase
VPYGAAVADCLGAIRGGARHTAPEAFVLESLYIDGEPVSANFFRLALADVRASIGISPEDQRRRNITPHSLRHSFISLARLAGVNDLEVQTLAGHSNLSMTDNYTHAAQAIDFTAARDKLAGVWTRRGA